MFNLLKKIEESLFLSDSNYIESLIELLKLTFILIYLTHLYSCIK